MLLASGEAVRTEVCSFNDALSHKIGMRDANGNRIRWRFDNAG